jgi:hypothetical protein
MPTVRTNAILPKGEENGFYVIARELIADQKKFRVFIAIADCRRVTTDSDTGEEIATLRIRRAEVVLTEDMPAAEKLIRRALEHRLGQTTLPLDLEDEIEQAFREMAAEDVQPELPADGDGDPEEDGGDPE